MREIQVNAVDPDYTRERAWSQGGRSARWMQLPVFAIAAMLFAMSAVMTTRAAPQIEKDRQAMVQSIEQSQQQQDALRNEIATTQAKVYDLQQQALANDAGSQRINAQSDSLAVASASTAVTGPGLTIVVDDATSNDPNSRVIDTDLQQMTNGLWQAGAEAISINGHRLTTLTAIRGAGDAITVDYRSLTRPYTVEVIGDPETLQQRFVATEGGTWWSYLQNNLGMTMNITREKALELPAASRVTLRYAKGGNP
ncbi:DUF881 domain-containing protein [Raineyella antarctica]|uniref:DUF881 domain-containing protein n=1 Tax=Raineyella antarctica TaxID=1577474 RepID=UPI00158806E2|nr:DUF881 domain-containing protein [Raineyella antarctica]